MFPTSLLDSPRRLRDRNQQTVSYPQNMDEEVPMDLSGYSAEDNLERATKDSGTASVPSPESSFSSSEHDEHASPSLPEQPEPVARKRAKHACDYCRTKKCRARPNASHIINFSAAENLNVRSVGRMMNSVITLFIIV